MRSVDSAGGGAVLVSDHVDGCSRSAVAAVRALAAAGYRPVVTVSGGRSAAGSSRSSSGVLRVPRPDSPGYREAIERHLAASPDLDILPASDAVLVALARPGAQLVDKAALPARAAAAGLEVPVTTTFVNGDDLLAVADRIDYPVVVKAAVKAARTAVARRVEAAPDLPRVLATLSGPVVVQPFAAGRMRAVCGVIHDGEVLASVHQSYLRIWPPGCGTACAAVTTEPDRELEARLPALLDGHSGVFQVQLVGDFVIDINPRVYGSLPLAVAAGANLPAIACAAARGRRNGMVRGRPGVRYRWLEGDVRRVVHDLRRRTLTFRAAAAALRPRAGTAHSVESWRDPGPGLVRLVDVAGRKLS